MTQPEFDLREFRNHLQELEKELTVGIEQDPNYDGEVDDVIAALKRLTEELKDKKYQQVLPDLFQVLEFLEMIEEVVEEEDIEDRSL